ncbi:MAG: hypothetical protein HC837_06590 [Chloroflexaceae bacterium]|nr:hypothetical protein [Chloroflexaceae bacterium]
MFLQDGRNPFFHVGFQGLTTHRVMKWRVLNTIFNTALVTSSLEDFQRFLTASLPQ